MWCAIGGGGMSVTIERISALLMKAERTDNEHEADAYLMKAQSLATLASIDLATARTKRKAEETPADPITRTVTIGEKGKRANTHLVSLFVVVAHNNFTMVDVAADSTYVIAYGMPQDLDVTHTLFASLCVQMATTAQVYLENGQWRSESYRVRSRSTGLLVTKKFTKQTARAAYYRAYVARIDERLQQAREQAMSEHDGAQNAASSAAVVLRKSETEVRAFHRQTSAARGSWSGYRGAVSGRSGSAAGAGREAASSARLSPSEELPGGRRELPS
jgi:hypothetical protein